MDPNLILMVALMAVWWFAFLQPQLREERQKEELLKSLVKDDRVITTSGIHGRIVSLADDTVVLDIAKNTHITIDKATVVRRQDAGGDDK